MSPAPRTTASSRCTCSNGASDRYAYDEHGGPVRRRDPRAASGDLRYDAFLSYSHAVDGQLAPAIQVGLQHLARPWYQVRALRVFRDDTGLAVNPHLWDSIATAIDNSRYFVLLLSDDAAASSWVNREIEQWMAEHPAESILPVLTGGCLQWDHARGDYDPA